MIRLPNRLVLVHDNTETVNLWQQQVCNLDWMFQKQLDKKTERAIADLFGREGVREFLEQSKEIFKESHASLTVSSEETWGNAVKLVRGLEDGCILFLDIQLTEIRDVNDLQRTFYSECLTNCSPAVAEAMNNLEDTFAKSNLWGGVALALVFGPRKENRRLLFLASAIPPDLPSDFWRPSERCTITSDVAARRAIALALQEWVNLEEPQPPRIERFLERIVSVTHDDCDNKTDFARSALAELVPDLQFDTLDDDLQRDVMEGLKSLGARDSNGGIADRLTTKGGWLLARSAFSEKNGSQWLAAVFSIEQLRGRTREYLLPEQSATQHDESVRAFYEMCLVLFRAEKKESEKGVTDSQPSEHKVTIAPGELVLKLAGLNGVEDVKGLSLSGLFSSYAEGKAEPKPAKTSWQLWRFLARSYLCSYPCSWRNDELPLRMYFLPERHQTTISFRRPVGGATANTGAPAAVVIMKQGGQTSDVVVVVDKAQTRRKAVEKAFRESGSDEWTDGPAGRCALLLWHLGDANELAPMARKTIYYGNTGYYDPRKPSPSADIINRRIPDDGMITPDEAAELLEYARRGGPKPKILRAPDSVETLSALAVLCQGYLAAHARRDENGHWGPPEIAEALRRMGWEAAQPMEPIDDTRRATCEAAAWWSEGIAVDVLQQGVVDEWGDTLLAGKQTVMRLLKTIAREQAIMPPLVAQAYCALEERLK